MIIISACDAIFYTRADCDVKGIRDQLMKLNITLMLLYVTEVVIPINTLCGSLQQHGFQMNLLNVRDLNPTCLKKCQEQQFYFGSTAKKFMEFTIEKTSLTDETVPMPQNYEKYRV